MMNYRHIYHAGNFADVVKHSVLTLILSYLRQKEAPFYFIDTHAGEGLYDLTSVEAQKTGESAAGVCRIIQNGDTHPECMNAYLTTLAPYRTGNGLSHYPGSPGVAYEMLRPQDGMILNELHPETHRRLKQNCYGKPQIAIHQRNAYEFLPAILPPPAPRGLVLIDPPFEQPDENEKIQCLLGKCLKRWAQGIYLIWYPVTTLRSWNVEAIALHNAIDRYLMAELTIAAEDPRATGLLGCQLFIVNPPWRLDETLTILFQHLWKIFNLNQQGGVAIHHKL